MNLTRKIMGSIAALTFIAAATVGSAVAGLTDIEKLGKNLFFDVRLSSPAGQSCASCHSPGAGFNGIGDANISVYEGAVSGRFGNRNPPSAAYASFSPVFSQQCNGNDCLWIGGLFWDGRATGADLGDPLAEQAKGPFLNPVEQNNKSAREVVTKVALSNYVDLFIKVYGAKDLLNTEKAYNDIAKAIAAYERSSDVNKFSSKYDLYLEGKVELTDKEMKGLKLFNKPGKGNCAACHPSELSADGKKPLFTDFSYDNLGVPKNGTYTGKDLGLGQRIPGEDGKFKVPTLRNVGVSPSYGHNGYFKTLKEIVHFYNTRGFLTKSPAWSWPDPPEVETNLNEDELGNLGLADAQEDAIVAFLLTLTDGFAPPKTR